MVIQCRLGLLSERSSRDSPAYPADSCPTRACISYRSVFCRPPDWCIPAGNVSVRWHPSLMSPKFAKFKLAKFTCAHRSRDKSCGGLQFTTLLLTSMRGRLSSGSIA
jgi:hypothetical protein